MSGYAALVSELESGVGRAVAEMPCSGSREGPTHRMTAAAFVDEAAYLAGRSEELQAVEQPLVLPASVAEVVIAVDAAV